MQFINMGNRSEKHVVHNPERGGWDVKNNNAQRASKHFETKADAMDWAREQAKKDGLIVMEVILVLLGILVIRKRNQSSKVDRS